MMYRLRIKGMDVFLNLIKLNEYENWGVVVEWNVLFC